MKCLSIHVTDLCNSQCSFCVVASPLYSNDSIDYAQVLSFLEANRNEGYQVVNLHGGEPTVHPRFLEILRAIHCLGYPELHLQTNGIKLSDPGLLEECVHLGVRKFIVSLHGDSADVQDGQTYSHGGFERTTAAIRRMKQAGARVRTNTVITMQNLDHLTGIAELACEMGVDHLNFSNLHPVGSARFGLDRIMPSLRAIVPRLELAIAVAERAGRRVTLEGFPYCAVPGRIGLHLNNEYRCIRMLMRGTVIEDYDTFMNDAMRVQGAPCRRCKVRERCGGVYPEYIAYFGWDEFDPVMQLLAERAPQPPDHRGAPVA